MTQEYRCPWCGNSRTLALGVIHGTVLIPELVCIGWAKGPHEPQVMIRMKLQLAESAA